MKLLIKNARLAFPVLFAPEKFQGQGEWAYTCTLLLPQDHPQIAEIEEAIKSVARDKWPKNYEQIIKLAKAKDNYTLHDGDLKDLDGYAGCYYINARTSGRNGAQPVRPTILNRDRTPLTIEDGRPYAGCYVNASIELWAQDNGYGQKVNASLRGVQFYRDGDAFAGGSAASQDEFESLAVEDEALV